MVIGGDYSDGVFGERKISFTLRYSHLLETRRIRSIAY